MQVRVSEFFFPPSFFPTCSDSNNKTNKCTDVTDLLKSRPQMLPASIAGLSARGYPLIPPTGYSRDVYPQ